MKNELREVQIMAIIEKQRNEYLKKGLKTKSASKTLMYMHMYEAMSLLHKAILIKKKLIIQTDNASIQALSTEEINEMNQDEYQRKLDF